MDITTTPATADSPPIFVLSGRFDAHEADAFRAAVDPVLADGQNSADVHLANVEFIDSTALAELVRLMKHTRESGGDLRVVSPSDPVQVILELTRLNAAFTIV